MKIERSSNFKRSRFETTKNEIKSRLERNVIIEADRQIISSDVNDTKNGNTLTMRTRQKEENLKMSPRGQIFKRTPQSFMSTEDDTEWKRLLERRKKCKDGLNITQVCCIFKSFIYIGLSARMTESFEKFHFLCCDNFSTF